MWQGGRGHLTALVARRRSHATPNEVERLKEQLLSTVSHELRTPLTAILGYARLLESGAMGPLTPEQQLGVQAIASRSEALSEVVSDLLDMSMLQAGLYRPFASRQHLEDLVRQALSQVRTGLGSRSIHVDVLPDVPRLFLDGPCVTKVLRHLVANAIKHTEANGEVTVRVRWSNEVLQAEVSDNGAGIPAECMPFLFEAFYQADGGNCRKTGGNGLGLALCRGLLEANGGSISAESQVGVGSTFRFSLKAPPSP